MDRSPSLTLLNMSYAKATSAESNLLKWNVPIVQSENLWSKSLFRRQAVYFGQAIWLWAEMLVKELLTREALHCPHQGHHAGSFAKVIRECVWLMVVLLCQCNNITESNTYLACGVDVDSHVVCVWHGFAGTPRSNLWSFTKAPLVKFWRFATHCESPEYPRTRAHWNGLDRSK